MESGHCSRSLFIWCRMPTAKKNDLKDRLARFRRIKISVIGRKSGRSSSNPVWFALESEKLYLLPVRGSDTQWYQNVLKNPSIRIDARGEEVELRAQPITESKMVKSVIDKFRDKYGGQRRNFLAMRSFWVWT
jgi:deazaflavin-dependent oxidoreductase (nitroreductase family)